MITYHYDVCILAGAPSTYIVAESLSRSGLKVLLCEDNSTEGPQFKPYYPFFFSMKGPMMEIIRTFGMEKLFIDRIRPVSLQIIIPAGRCELYQNAERRKNELRWLLGNHFESEMNKLEKLRTLSDKIKRIIYSPSDKNRKMRDRISLWFLKNKLSHKSKSVNAGEEHFFLRILKNYLALPLLNGTYLSPFYSSIIEGDAFTLEDYPASFANLMKKNLSPDIEIIPLSDVKINKNLLSLKRGKESITFKYIIVDTMFVKNLFPEYKIFRNLKPLYFWFPVQLRIKREGFPVGMGRNVLFIKPDIYPENASLLYIETGRDANEVMLNTYSLWRIETLDNKKWSENIVGSVMDCLMEFMPFVNKHLLHLIYPEKIEDIPRNFFNYVYNLKTRADLFSPVIKSKLKRRVFISGPELFPHWGIDADAMSAQYVANKIRVALRV